jgi:hypothetical protein
MGYSLRKLLLLPFCWCLLFASEPNVTHSDAISVKEALDQLRVTGSVLMIAAHPTMRIPLSSPISLVEEMFGRRISHSHVVRADRT